MQAVLRWLFAHSSPRQVWAAFGAEVVAQVLFGAAHMLPGVQRIADALPDVHLGYDGAGLMALVEVLAEAPALTVLVYGLDVAMPTVGALFFGLWIASLVVAVGRQKTAWRYLAVLPTLGLCVDLVENASVLGLVALYPSENIVAVSPLLRAVTTIKWALHTAGVGAIMVLLVAYFRRPRRARS